MVGFYYDNYGIDIGLESVSEDTRQQVLSVLPKGLRIAHQIGVVEEAFASFKVEGHYYQPKDNLFPLCPSCHQAYDAGSFPGWVLIPDESTLQNTSTTRKKTMTTVEISSLRQQLVVSPHRYHFEPFKFPSLIGVKSAITPPSSHLHYRCNGLDFPLAKGMAW